MSNNYVFSSICSYILELIPIIRATCFKVLTFYSSDNFIITYFSSWNINIVGIECPYVLVLVVVDTFLNLLIGYIRKCSYVRIREKQSSKYWKSEISHLPK